MELPLHHIDRIDMSEDGVCKIYPKVINYAPKLNHFRVKALQLTDMIEHMDELRHSGFNDAVVLELGTRWGTSTSAFAVHAKHVYTIDIDDCRQYIPVFLDNVTVIQANTLTYQYNQILNPSSVNVALIDTLHTYEQIKLEWQAIFDYLANDAVVYFHDVNMREVARAIDEILQDQRIIIVSYHVLGKVYPLAKLVMQKK